MHYRDLQGLLLTETLLYRGDSTTIDQFDLAKTEKYALFGAGIYLTSDPQVAHDYTVTGSHEHILYPRKASDPESRTSRDLLRNYVLSLADQFDELRFQATWMQQHGLDRYAGLSSRLSREYDNDKNNARQRGIAAHQPAVLARVKADLPNLRAIKLTTGALRLVHRDLPSAVSVFDIPDAYLNQVLHAEQPLPDNVLAAIKRLFLGDQPATRVIDMRDADGKYRTFDDWVKAYKTSGILYAWAGEERNPVVSGRGRNPDLDVIRNGTHFGGHWFAENGQMFADAMQALGYVGLEYEGGKRIGAFVRGGGRRRHRAFVFWDVAALHRFRQSNMALPAQKGFTARNLSKF